MLITGYDDEEVPFLSSLLPIGLFHFCLGYKRDGEDDD